MKSIIQEGNSIAKAVEQAWLEADRPKSFSVKVLQESEKNFFGITTKSAKIALMFQEEPVRTVAQAHAKEYSRRPIESKKPVEQERKQPDKKVEPVSIQKQQWHDERTEVQRQDRVFWTDEMLATVNSWLTTSLNVIGSGNVRFSTEKNKYLLKIVFQNPVHENAEKERDIFRNFSLLILQALKHKLKRPLKGFKILLVRA
jgi:hypothetical protein